LGAYDETTTNTTEAPGNNIPASFCDEVVNQCDHMMQEYWEANPDLYRIVQQRNQEAAIAKLAVELPENNIQSNEHNPVGSKEKAPWNVPLRGARLRAQIRSSHQEIQQDVLTMGAAILPRTQAHNRKAPYTTIEEERAFRSDMVAAQIRVWRSLLPGLLRRLSHIPDPRRATSIKHKLAVLMVFGLFAFIFRLASRREMNRELTGALIHENLKKIFPEVETIPHADTLARLLENINPQDIEAVHIHFIKDLIKKKKFRRLLINKCLPITVDGTQKLYRDGLLEDARWCERSVGNPEDENKQQYIYVIEANITLQNGLTIPLITEYLYRENNQLAQPEGKQDSETTAFERMAERLKKYFPRLNMIFFMDAMYGAPRGA